VDLLETGLVDSVKIVELVLEIEQRFGVSLPFEELEIEDFRTVPRLAERIARTTPAVL
jgi:acyl carrier protein